MSERGFHILISCLNRVLCNASQTPFQMLPLCAQPLVYVRSGFCLYVCYASSCMLPISYNKYKRRGRSQVPLLFFLLVSLHLVSDLELVPLREADTTFAAFFHFRYIFLDVFN